MKKFFKFGKDKNKTLTPEPSPKLSRQASSTVLCGYEVREKELGKLHKAAWNGDLNKVKQLAKKDTSPLDKQNRTPLHLACARGYASIVNELLEWRAKTNVCDNEHRTPLLKAVECKQERCVELLLENKADPNAKDVYGESSLHYAVRDGAINILQKLLKSDKIFVDIKNKDGRTPLHIALKNRNLKIAEILLQHGADINVADNRGYTVLMEAAQDGATDVVKFLLEHGADAKREDENGWTADDIALKEHQEAVRDVLAEYACGNSTELDPGMIMDTQTRKKSDKDMIPAPVMYGGPACNEDGDYSEIDASKISEAAGGLDTWNDNTDDESESQLEDKLKKPKLNVVKMSKQTEGNKQNSQQDVSIVSARSAPSELSLVTGDWSDEESILSIAHEKKTSVIKQQHSIDNTENMHKQNATEESQQDNISGQLTSDEWDDDSVLLSSPRHKKNGINNMKRLTSVTEEDTMDNTKSIDKEDNNHQDAAASKKQTSTSDEAEKRNKYLQELNLSDVEDVSDPDFGDTDCMSGLNSEPIQKVETSSGQRKQDSPNGNDSDWDSTMASDLSPRAKAPSTGFTNQSHGLLTEDVAAMDKEEKQNYDFVDSEEDSEDFQEDDIAEIPEITTFNKSNKKEFDEFEHKDENDGDEVFLGHKSQNSLGREIPKSSTQLQNTDTVRKPSPDGGSPDEDSKWDSGESEATEPPPLPTEAPPPISPSAAVIDDVGDEVEVENLSEEEDHLKKEQEERSREWQHEMEQQKLQQQKEAIEELEREKQEACSPSNINYGFGQLFDSVSAFNEKEVQKDTLVKNTVIVNTVRVEEDGFTNDILEEHSRRHSEQRHAVDKELAELRVQKQVSRHHQSFDDEDTFHNVPDMESPRKTDFSGGGYLPVGIITTNTPDDDCLSYSSTEHEISVHDESRSHQLVPVSFSMSTDSTNVMRLQQQLRDTQQKLEKERSARMCQENKRKSLDKEREELIQKLEAVSKAKSQLEQQKIDMEATIRNLQYQLKEESEKCKNFEVLYNKTREQLSRKDDQFTLEVESKQKSDLSLRNLQMELHTAQSLIKQLEEEKEDLERQLTHEKSARLLQEQINEEQVKYQQSFSKEIKDSDAEMAVLSRMETITDSKNQAVENIEKTNIELHATKLELERLRSRSKDDHDLMASENDELRKKIDDLKAALKINEEALAEASMKYNLELTALNTENTKLKANLENEKTTREKLESEVESLRHRLGTTSLELSKAQEARNELERHGFSQQEDLSRQLEKRDQELTRLQEKNQNLLQRVSDLDNKANKLENELHIANATLIERTNQLSTIQRELDQRCNNQETAERELQKTKEENVRLQAKLETLQERVASLQQEVVTLRQQLDDARVQAVGVGKEEGDRFTMMLTTLREDHDKSGLEEYLHKLEQEKAELESQLKQETHKVKMLQQELDDSHKHQNSSRSDDVIAQLECDNREIRCLYEEEKKKAQRAAEMKKKTEIKLSAEQERIAELQKEVVLLKTHLKAAKKRLKLEEVNRKAHAEANMREQLEGKTRQLEAELSAVRSMEKSYSKLDKAKRKLEEDLSLYRSHVDDSFTDQTDLERLKAELEAKARLELNRKLEEVNIFLEEQARARDKLDRMRDINEAEMKKEFERSRNELLEDINRIRQNYTELLNQKEFGTDDAQRFKRLYEAELQAREQLTKRLEKALKMQERAQTLIDRQHKSGTIYGPTAVNGWTSTVNKPTLNHGLNDTLSTKIQHELDRSIAKHLEKGPHTDIMTPSRSLHDSQLSSSPYKSSADYLSVLKKNYFL